jgi:tetratricopeptide (TPR) repeat protein
VSISKKTTAPVFAFAFVVLSTFVAARAQSPEQLYKDAVSADERGDATQAVSLYERLIKLRPHSVAVRTNFGAALARLNRYSEAITQYQQALKQDPGNQVVQLDLALAWYKQGDFEKAATRLGILRKQHSENRQSLYLLADCYLRLGRNSDAVALLEPEHQENPDDDAVDYALGTALIRQGRIQQGEIIIDRILKNGGTAEANLLMGEAQFAAGDYKAATATLRKALDLNANLPGGWTLYGRSLLNSQNHFDAKLAFQRALQADQNDFAANLYLGSMLRVDSDISAAAPYLERALRLRPNSPEAGFQVAALNAATGKLDEARKKFEQLERKWPDFLEVHVQLATVYSRLGLSQQSQRERETVLKLNQKSRDSGRRPEP